MEIFRPGGLRLTDKAAEFVKLRPGDRVLDVGCGLGTSLKFLRDEYKLDIYGLDINSQVVLKAKKLLDNDNICCASAESLPYEDDLFHAVFMECVLSLTENPEKVLLEALRVLRPEAYLIITTLDGAEELLKDGRIGRNALVNKLKEFGFEIALVSDESAELRQFIAEIIFKYDSLQKYIDYARQELGGAVLSCDVPLKGTGYSLVIAKK